VVNDADNNDKKQQSTNVQRQRPRACAVAEAEDSDGWQEVGRSGGGRGATVVRRQRRNSAIEDGVEVEDGRGGVVRGVPFFLFLAELNPTFNPTHHHPKP
jgi:hypothetical protein